MGAEIAGPGGNRQDPVLHHLLCGLMLESDLYPRQFVVTLRPWLLWILSSTMTVAGLAMMVTLGQSSRLMCDRSPTGDGLCKLTQANVLQDSTVYFPVAHLETVQMFPPAGITRPQNALWLRMGDRYIPVPIYVTLNPRERLAIAARIQRFVYNPDLTTLEWVSDHRWFAYGLGGSFILAGLGVGLRFGAVVTCRFDKQRGIVTLQRQGLGRPQRQTYPLDAIAAVQLETSDGSAGPVYRICLELEARSLSPGDPTQIPLTPYYRIGRDDHEGLMHQIQQFLAH
jgi:hypothetical protein